jgi:hypothetical protein
MRLVKMMKMLWWPGNIYYSTENAIKRNKTFTYVSCSRLSGGWNEGIKPASEVLDNGL